MEYSSKEVQSFKYLQCMGTMISRDGVCMADLRLRITAAIKAMTAMARLKRMWNIRNVSFSTKYKLHKSTIVSILLCGWETWSLLTD